MVTPIWRQPLQPLQLGSRHCQGVIVNSPVKSRLSAVFKGQASNINSALPYMYIYMYTGMCTDNRLLLWTKIVPRRAGNNAPMMSTTQRPARTIAYDHVVKKWRLRQSSGQEFLSARPRIVDCSCECSFGQIGVTPLIDNVCSTAQSADWWIPLKWTTECSPTTVQYAVAAGPLIHRWDTP